MTTPRPHKWQPSTLGHGEQQCAYCLATNREIAVIGDLNHCDKAPDDTKVEIPTVKESSYSVLADFTHAYLTINNIVKISLADGTITRLSGYTTTEFAAVEFWNAVSLMFPFGNNSAKLLSTARTLAAYALNAGFGATLQPFEIDNLTALAKTVGCTVSPRQRQHGAIRDVLEELLAERLHQFEIGFTPDYDDANPLHGRMGALHRLNDPNHTYKDIVEAAAILVADLERRRRAIVTPTEAVPPVLRRTKNGHVLYAQGDSDAPDSIKDSNVDVVLGLCRLCGAAEIELDVSCTGEKVQRAP